MKKHVDCIQFDKSLKTIVFYFTDGTKRNYFNPKPRQFCRLDYLTHWYMTTVCNGAAFIHAIPIS